MIFYSCPFCHGRISTSSEDHLESIECPVCGQLLVLTYQERTLVEKIKDSSSPLDLITTLNDSEE